MVNFRRYYVPDAIVFITQVVHQRSPIFQNEEAAELLRTTTHRVKELHPFAMLGYVFMPDHFHLLIRPTGKSNFSQIMHSLKGNFTWQYKRAIGCSEHLAVWQKRFWDHVIRDEADLHRHLDYIHYNPVKHGLVEDPFAWPYSSFRVWQERGAYPEGWGSVPPETVTQCGPMGE
jgi:putative transposase